MSTGLFKGRLLTLVMTLLISSAHVTITRAQCNAASSFTKITNTGGSTTYPGTNGSGSVNVSTTSTGRVSTISFCGITNGFRAGEADRSGSYKFAFSPAVNGILINLNALSNTPGDKETVRIMINDIAYTVTPGNIVCSASCFGCSGVPITASNGSVNGDVSPGGNGTGQLLIQGAGAINSIEYINELQAGDPQGSVFEIFFNNSTCLLPVVVSSFAASGSIAGVHLSWSAGAEVNVSYYEIQRSTDGSSFSTLAKLPANNSGSYRYADVTTEPGSYFYRLKIVDVDGRYEYSKILSSTLQAIRKRVLFNPQANVLTIAGLSRTSTISIYTAGGKQIVKMITVQPIETVSTANWPGGMYIVRVITNGNITTEKVLKQ